MGPIKLIFFALRLFLSLGLIYGYGKVASDMARAALHAQTHDLYSAKAFNRSLWSGGKK